MLTLLGAQVKGAFQNVQLELPVRSVAALKCPEQWVSGNNGSIKTTLQNPSDKPMTHTLTFLVVTYLGPTDSAQSLTLSATVPGAQSVDISSPDIRPSDTAYYEFVSVLAISDEDAEKAPWDRHSSYHGSCGVRLSANSSSRQLTRLALISAACVVFGTVLCYYVNRHLNRRRHIIAGLIGLVVLAIEFALLLSVLAPASWVNLG